MSGGCLMSVELPEAHILAMQMSKVLIGKVVQAYELQNCQNLQKLGCVNKDASAFGRLVDGKVVSVVSRGNVIVVKFSNGWNLVLAPEYGGSILFHKNENTISSRFHLKLRFQDSTALTVGLTGLGCIQAVIEADLEKNYLYRRDFSQIISPLDTKEFTLERFLEKLAEKNQNIKAALVGKTAVVVGLSNSAFQDIIYRAKIRPKRNTSTLSSQEKTALYNAIACLIQERIKAGGKNQLADLYGKQGTCTSTMGPNMKDQNCPTCNTKIEKINHGGGQVYYCPKCQS
jgi:formamidopyrimidine-DNA glycosylase